MQILNSSLKNKLHKGQGAAARALNKLPSRVHHTLAHALGIHIIIQTLIHLLNA